MKEIKILNESSAITMYYGYTKYRDNFVIEKNKVDPTIEKNILFIDIGYSKTSFILSNFKYNEFRVEYVLCNPYIGGRNFDELIYNYCINEFIRIKKINKNEFKITSKMKYRLIEVIKKSRVQLTVNTETTILVDVFYNEEDLEIILTKEIFENLIKNYLNEIENNLNSIIKYSKEKKIKIDCVEIAGEIMRTPILQEMIEKYNLKICKTILIDECTSVGAALLGNYIYEKLPISNFKYFYHFNYYKISYLISLKDLKPFENNIFLDFGTVLFKEKDIFIHNDLVKEEKPILLKFYYLLNNNNNIENMINNNILIEYEIDLFKLLNDNKINPKNKNKIILKINIDDSQKISIKKLFINNKEIKLNYKILKKGIYKNEEEENEFKIRIKKQYKIHKSYDLEYQKFIDKKNKIAKKLYHIKEKIEKKSKTSEDLIKIINLDKKLREVKKDAFFTIENELNAINNNYLSNSKTEDL